LLLVFIFNILVHQLFAQIRKKFIKSPVVYVELVVFATIAVSKNEPEMLQWCQIKPNAFDEIFHRRNGFFKLSLKVVAIEVEINDNCFEFFTADIINHTIFRFFHFRVSDVQVYDARKGFGDFLDFGSDKLARQSDF
jgi:hypothetical protein